jgi:hypothetical protein
MFLVRPVINLGMSRWVRGLKKVFDQVNCVVQHIGVIGTHINVWLAFQFRL